MWFREYTLATMKNVLTERHLWFWDGAESVDPAKTATAQEKRLANNTTTLAAECAKEGRDYLSVLRQRAKELKLMRQLGIPIPDMLSKEVNQSKLKEKDDELLDKGGSESEE